jgi:uncharacterized membrane protein YqaE (UPF0057 family)
MRYFLAILLPPAAVLLCGKPGALILNLVLTVFGYIPGILHAILIVMNTNADARNKKVTKAIKEQTKMLKQM